MECRRAADRRRPRHRRHPRRGAQRRTGRAAGRRRRARRPARSRRRRWPRSTPHRSSSAWNCGRARSPNSPTWCSRSRPSSRRRGAFVNWEGRIRPFEPALQTNAIPGPAGAALPGRRARRRPEHADARWPPVTRWPGSGCGAAQRPSAPQVAPSRARRSRARARPCSPAGACCSTTGRLQDGEPHLAGTAHQPVARLSAATAAEIGAAEGDLVTVSTDRGAITLPLVITDMPDGTVWLPLNSPGSAVLPAARRDTGSRRLDRAGSSDDVSRSDALRP